MPLYQVHLASGNSATVSALDETDAAYIALWVHGSDDPHELSVSQMSTLRRHYLGNNSIPNSTDVARPPKGPVLNPEALFEPPPRDLFP